MSVDLAHHEIFHAKDGRGGIKVDMMKRYTKGLYYIRYSAKCRFLLSFFLSYYYLGSQPSKSA